MTQTFSKPVPMHAKQIDPVPLLEAQWLAKQAALLKAAEEGDEEAIARLREKGLTYWERHGRRIV